MAESALFHPNYLLLVWRGVTFGTQDVEIKKIIKVDQTPTF